MKNTSLFMIALCVSILFIIVSHSGQVTGNGNSGGFISIDCGARRDYTDNVTGFWYQTDESFIASGNNLELATGFNYDDNPAIARQLNTVRIFPEGERNCYTLKPNHDKNKNKYLVRAIFAYGNYDSKNQVPVFDLHLGVNYWVTVNSTNSEFYEIIIMQQDDDATTNNMVQVCLINTGQGTPFISALELRPLNNSLYPAPLPLSLSRRADIVASGLLHNINRYKDDAYDRFWVKYNYDDIKGLVPIETKEEVKAESSIYELPSEVLCTALMQTMNDSNNLSIDVRGSDIFSQFYMFLHFAEIQKLPPGHKRLINVTFYDENSSSQELALEFLKPITLSSKKMTKGHIGFTVRAAANSDAPPIINALEIYQFLPQQNFPTATQDINAMMEIKHIYGVSRISWQGDPCVPSKFAWDGLSCSSGGKIRIISLNLSSMKLTGPIATLFARLEKLESLDLSNNELTGPLPEFLATLSNLKFIDVTGNKLTGSIPKALMEKANLQLSVANNPGLCQTNSCKKHKIAIPLIASLPALIIIIVLISLVFWRFREKTVCSSTESWKMDLLKEKNQAFSYSYSDVVRITNNFEIAIGKGGFGEVYLGTVEGDTKVAVKLLSQSSRQGYQEFQSEAQLLTVIHHINLVSLVGFCDENDVKALIYEYMDLGDLSVLVSEKNSNVLKWNERLRIAIDAAKGVEYLHNGCKTPIIHRDLKPSNILLNKFMVAKIADFGLSRVFTNEGDSHLSTRPAGTPGFIDPEFQRSGKLDKRSDMYSFGMILLQLITGYPPVRRELESICFIVDWIRPNIECGDIQSIVDKRLKGEFNVSSAWKAVETAMSCIALPSIQRPDISYVLHELKECLAMEIDHANSNGLQSHPINHFGQLDLVTALSAR